MKSLKFVVGLIVQLFAATLIFAAIVFWPGPRDPMAGSAFASGFQRRLGLFIARLQLGKSFAVNPQAKELVTHGLYSKIRNPMYLFSGLLVLSFALALGCSRHFCWLRF